MAAPWDGRLSIYLGSGTAASRPAAPNIPTGYAAYYYATDTSVLSVYISGTGWSNVNTGGTITALTGDVTASGMGSVAATIANDAVTYAKMQNVSAASKLLGRGDSGSGDTQEITLGSGLTMSGTTLSAGGGSGNIWRLSGGPLDNEAPASNYATLDSRNSHPVLDFDTTTSEAAVWTRIMPSDYSGAGITVNIWAAATSATSGTIGWLISLERMDASTLDIDADSFASANTLTAVTVPGTSGQFLKMTLNISNGANMDSIAAGELFRIKIARDVANDTATGDAELLRWEMVSQ